MLIGLVAAGVVWATPRVTDATLSLVHNDQVHYGGHLIAGRILSLCPCTTHLAETQYVKGMYHARTPHQVALLTSLRPTSMRALLVDAPQLAAAAIQQIASRLTA